MFKCALKVGLPGALEGTHFKILRVFTLEKNKSVKKLCFSVQTIFWNWLNCGQFMGLLDSFWVVFFWWNCFFSQKIYHHDISAKLSMHNFTPMKYFYISTTFYILCLFYCLVSVTSGLEISIGHWTMTDSNKCLTDLKLLQSDIVSKRKIKTMEVFKHKKEYLLHS